MKTLVRQNKQESWDKFVSDIEDDVHGRQQIAFKLIRKLNNDKREAANITVIDKDEWVKHYTQLWYTKEGEQDNEGVQIESNGNVDTLTLQELDNVLRAFKNRKATGLDNVNLELIKYGGLRLKLRFLEFINMCWVKVIPVPQNW